jgi:uncharacterized membrane protein
VAEEGGRSAERLVTFTDAVVAIAITLLALPLADIVRGEAPHGMGAVLRAGAGPLLGFTISFFVIARLWWSHHRTFAHIERWDATVVVLTVVWLFTVVLLAPVTSLPSSLELFRDRLSIALYIGTMSVSSALLTALAWHVHRTPELTDGRDEDAGHRLFTSVETTISFIIALVVGTAVPTIGYFALLSLVITGRIGHWIWNRWHRAR